MGSRQVDDHPGMADIAVGGFGLHHSEPSVELEITVHGAGIDVSVELTEEQVSIYTFGDNRA